MNVYQEYINRNLRIIIVVIDSLRIANCDIYQSEDTTKSAAEATIRSIELLSFNRSYGNMIFVILKCYLIAVDCIDVVVIIVYKHISILLSTHTFAKVHRICKYYFAK